MYNTCTRILTQHPTALVVDVEEKYEENTRFITVRRPKPRQHRTFYNIDELWRKLLSNSSTRPSFLSVAVIKMFSSSVLAGVNFIFVMFIY